MNERSAGPERSRKEVVVGVASGFPDPGRKVFEIGGVEVGVFRLGDEFFAYENVCPHMAGPVCQGRMMPRVEERIDTDKTSLGMSFSRTQTNVACPWHGYEFDVRTGAHHGNARLRLRRIEVRVVDGKLMLCLPERSREVRATAQPARGGGERTPAAKVV